VAQPLSIVPKSKVPKRSSFFIFQPSYFVKRAPGFGRCVSKELLTLRRINAERSEAWDTAWEGVLTMKKWLMAIMAVFVITASAADVSGTWKGSVETPNGAMETTFVFKVDAGKVTGTATMGQMGESPISEGKVDGDTVTFAVVRQGPNGEFRINYSGKATGDDMRITATIPAMDRTFEMTAKRSK
jgi:hypothetical protein